MDLTTYEFRPQFQVIGSVPGHAAIADLERERGVYSATPEFVEQHCGGIARRILAQIPSWYFDEAARLGLYPNCDVRIHRLYPGDFPAYPGWHCDGEYRETYFAQPDLARIQVHKHITCTVSSHADGVSNTQFLDEPFTVSLSPPDQEHTLWGQVDRALGGRQSLHTWDSLDGQLVCFDSWSLHRCRPAKIRGWRLFFRMSMWHRPNLGDGGMLTKQEQIYKLYEGTGW